MVSKRVMRAMVLVVLLTASTGMAVWADVITLGNGEVFSDLQVKRFDGQTRQFDVQSNGKTVEIAASEVADVRFDPRQVTLSLTDGKSVYSSIEVQQFDGARGRFSIHRGAKVVEINAAEVASIDFTPTAEGVAGRSIQSASTVVDQPGMLPPVLRPIQVVPPPAVPSESSETTLVKKESVATAASLPPPPPNFATGQPLPPPPSTMEGTVESVGDEATSGGWDDDALYGALGDNFGQPKTVVPGQVDAGYTARWKGSGAASGDSLKGDKKSESGSAKKKTGSSSASKGKGGGHSTKKKGEGGSDKEMSDKDDRSSSKSSRRSSRSDRNSESNSNSRNSSRYGSDSYGNSSSSSRYGNSNSSSRYGGNSSSYGGYGSNSSNYGSNSSSRYSNY